MNLKLLTPLAALTLGGACSAATILMDYDDGLANGMHDSIVQNGDIGVQDWTDFGSGLQYSTANNSGVGSAQNLVMGSNRFAAHDLNYVASVGDEFEASYMWRAAANWDAADRITFTLYYTDNDQIDGVRTEFYTYEPGSAATTTYGVETVTNHVLTDAGAQGKKIYVLLGDNASAVGGEFARVDNIYVGVTSVPEPTSSALLGLGAVGMILRRRRG